MQYFFVTGAHKSGTSWLKKLISSHPNVAMPDHELWMLGNRRSVAGLKFDKLAANWLALPTVAHVFKADNRQELIASLRRAVVVSILSRFADDTTKALGDKSPLYTVRALDEIKQSFPDAVVILIVRDGRDVVVSHHFHKLRGREFAFYEDPAAGEAAYLHHVAGSADRIVPLLNQRTIRRVSSDWVECATAEPRARELFGDRALCLRYESLLADPSPHLRSIFDLLGLEHDDALLDGIVRQASFEAATGGRKLGESDPRSFVRKGAPGDWINYFSREDAGVFNEIAGEALVSAGYARSLDWYSEQHGEHGHS
jgi:hypothetical protein